MTCKRCGVKQDERGWPSIAVVDGLCINCCKNESDVW